MSIHNWSLREGSEIKETKQRDGIYKYIKNFHISIRKRQVIQMNKNYSGTSTKRR